MTTDIYVIKRNGDKVFFDASKINKVITWACEGVEGVSASDIVMKSQLHLYNKISTAEIHEVMIKSAAELITEETPNYQYVAGRLINYALRKEVYGQYEPIPLISHIKNIVKNGYYTKDLLTSYSEDEWKYLNKYINHKRDFKIVYAGMEQIRSKYLVRNRQTKRFYETPQMMFMLISAMFFINESKDIRLDYVIKFYNHLSNFDISLPTPIFAGLRTNIKQFSSCTLIDCDDSIDSIIATNGSMMKYVVNKAGIGLNIGRIRGTNTPIRDGDVLHTGVGNFVRMFQATVNSCNQGGVRKGSATLNYPFWHWDFEELIVLKNSKGTEFNRARHVDYVIQLNKLFYERVKNNENITLFSPHDVPDLYDAFSMNQDKFNELYVKYETYLPKSKKRTIPAKDVLMEILKERKETGRIYIMNIDHANEHGAFIEEEAPIRMTNLCVEVLQTTEPLKTLDDPDGRIALCTLASVNQGNITSPEDYKEICTIIVRALDNLLSYQDYPVLAAEKYVEDYRSLGIGLTNYAYWLAKNKQSYSSPDLGFVHEYLEAFAYYITKASADLAVERGACKENNKTKYSKGILPIHTYKKTVDELVEPKYNYDWESLSEQLKETGIRNAPLMAQMPNESNSLVSNSTNGIEPIRAYIVSKRSKDGVIKQVAPKLKKFKYEYELLWDITRPDGYLKHCAIIQKFFDQGISVNTSYDAKNYEGNLKMSHLIVDLFNFYKYGGKNLYYLNTNDGAGEIDVEMKESEVEMPEINTESCESCVL